jgi:hypothetical protein
MTRLFSSTSVATTLLSTISNSATTITVATGTGTALLNGVTLAVGNVDQFTIALDVDTINEEIVFVTAASGDTLTVVRGQAGTSGITHTAGATVKHVLTGDDLTFFNAGVITADAAIPETIVTNKGDLIVATGNGVVTNVALGSNDYVLTADSSTASGVKWAATASPTPSGDATTTTVLMLMGG